jgi:hypothetical protein
MDRSPLSLVLSAERKWLPGSDTLANGLELDDTVLCCVMLKSAGAGCLSDASKFEIGEG